MVLEYTEFRHDVVQMDCPADWSCEVKESEEGLSVGLTSPDATFAVVGVHYEESDPDVLVEEVLDSLRGDYPGLEVEESPSANAEDESAVEVTFLSLDTVCSCWIRGWRVGDRCVLVMVQSTDAESTVGEAVFDRLCATVEAAE